ncbi:MAG: hypothetical protein ACRDRW_02735 [Pseudonocardiaceae bacterium]
MVRHGFPEHLASAGPLVLSRLPLSTPPTAPPEQVAGSIAYGAGPRPWGTRFAVPAVVEGKHRKRRTHGVRKKETKYIDDGKEHTDSIDEPYEDEVDE